MKRIINHVKEDWHWIWRTAAVSAISGGITGFVLALFVKHLSN